MEEEEEEDEEEEEEDEEEEVEGVDSPPVNPDPLSLFRYNEQKRCLFSK